jgi:hypothetical protein
VISARFGRQKAAISAGEYRPAKLSSLQTNMKKILAFGIAAIVSLAPAAHAQRSSQRSNPIEFGVDGGAIFGLDAPRVTVVALPLQDFRVGFLVSDNLELEPRFNINSIHGNGGSVTTYSFEVGALYQPAGDRVGNGFYGRPFIGVSGVHVTGTSNNSGYMGIGAGLKIPFSDRRLATRMEANYAHGFSNGGSNQIGLLIGLSFFTR